MRNRVRIVCLWDEDARALADLLVIQAVAVRAEPSFLGRVRGAVFAAIGHGSSDDNGVSRSTLEAAIADLGEATRACRQAGCPTATLGEGKNGNG